MTHLFTFLVYLIEGLLAVYALYTVSYTFISSLAGLFRKKKTFPVDAYKRKFAVLIPAYKEDAVIVSVAKQALKQNYQTKRFDIVIIADSLKSETLAALNALPIKVIEVRFEKSTKVKALNAAFATLPSDYDVALILDADNTMEANCLELFNAAFKSGYKAVQGRRTAKNRNASFAVLDGLSETINNHIYRKGQNALGFAASLIGSGMAFDYKILVSTLSEMTSIGGFDRELEVRLLGQGISAYYLEEAVIYDEKVDNPENFGRQRTRWIAAQYLYLFKYFGKGMKAFFKGHFSYFNSSILRNIQLPRIINLGLLGMIVGIVLVFHSFFSHSLFFWISIYLIYLVAFIFAIPFRLYDKGFFQSLFRLPQAFFIMVLSLFKMRSATDKFIHTPHSQVETEKPKE